MSTMQSKATIHFTVYGKAQTAGSKRAFPFKRRDGRLGVAVSDDNPNSRDWKNAVASQARLALGDGFGLLEGPIELRLTFYIVRPNGHFGSGKNADAIKASAPEWPTVKPDVLKLTRAVEDALTGVVWRDDSQVVREVLEKRYGEPARVEVVVATAPSSAAAAARNMA